MRILLDECLPARLRGEIIGHDVRTVRQMKWLGAKNGRLLKLISDSGEFDVFLTMDKNLPLQQEIAGLSFAIIILRAKSNRFEDTQPLISEVIQHLPKARRGHVTVVGSIRPR